MWSKIDPEITIQNGQYTIPLNGMSCDMFSNFTTNKFKLTLQTKKDQISNSGNDEFAVFLADDLTTFLGQEFGFRFRLDHPKNVYSIYSAAVIGKVWFEIPFKIGSLEDVHVFEVEVKRWWIFNVAFFRVDGVLKWVLPAFNWGKPFWLVLTSHNWSSLPVSDLFMRLIDLEVS